MKTEHGRPRRTTATPGGEPASSGRAVPENSPPPDEAPPGAERRGAADEAPAAAGGPRRRVGAGVRRRVVAGPRGRVRAGVRRRVVAGPRGRVRAGVRRRTDGVRRRVGRRLAAPDVESLVLRLGLAFVFTYAALAAFADPGKFERYIPSAIAHPWVAHWCLPVFSTLELVLAAALATGRRLALASTIAAVTVAGITLGNPSHFDVLFRNVAIACAALSLAVRSRGAHHRRATVIVLPD